MFEKFPHIEQFKSAIKQVRDHCKYHTMALPKLVFTGTVKLHGTNACAGLNVQTGERFYQSRERMIDIKSDNAGFAMWASGSKDLENYLKNLALCFSAKETVHIYGEWAGKGVQKGVAISELEKSFYIFGIKIDGEWVPLPEPLIDNGQYFERIHFINNFPSFEVEIDFQYPEAAQNELVRLTMEVEQECPVSKQLGVSGIGEGIVWNCDWEGMHLMFKTKGEKHSASKVNSLKEIAPIDAEKIATTKEFVSKCMSENRLEQGIAKLGEMGLDASDPKNTGAYIKWCVDDVFREERDTIVASELDSKVLGRELSTIARQYFLNRV